MERQRDTSIDLLRILSTLMVVGTHVLTFGGIIHDSWGQMTANVVSATVLRALCKCAVDCFALISGYILCQSRFRLRRILRLWSQVFLYSVMFTLLYKIIDPRAVSLKGMIFAFLPVSSGRLWYVSAYFGLFFLMPFLNRLLQSLSRNQHLKLSLITFLLFSVQSTVMLQNTYGMGDTGQNLFWLAVLYAQGAYFRLHPRRYSRRACALVLVGFVALSAGLQFAIAFATERVFGMRIRVGWFNLDMSPTIVPIAVSMFLLFKDITIRNKLVLRAIAWAAPLSFGVYIIHMQPIFIEWLRGRFTWVAYVHPAVFPFAVVLSTGGIFAACMLLDFLRERLFKLIKFDSALAAAERKALSVWGKLLGLTGKVI